MQEVAEESTFARMQRLFGLKRAETAPLAEEKENGEKRAKVDEEEETKSYTVVHVNIVQDVLRHYAALLTADERRVLSAFLAFSDATQKVFVRLLGRKYRMFRCSQLSYSDTEAALLELQRSGFATLVAGGLDFGGSRLRALSFLRLARVQELRTVAAAVAMVERGKLSRDALLEKLTNLCGEGEGGGPRRSQSTLSFAGGAPGKKHAQAIENALVKTFCGSSSTLSSSSSGTQSSLLALWGGKKKSDSAAAEGEEAGESEGAKSTVSAQFIARHGFAVVLSHAVCALFDRVEMLFFLDMSDVRSLIMAKRDQLQYPRYTCNRHGIPFATREQMLAYVAASHLLHVFLLCSEQLPDPGNPWGSLSSDDIPIPGRPIVPNDLPPDFCRRLLLQTCLALHEEGCFDVSLDPLAATDNFPSLASELERCRAELGEEEADTGLSQLVARLAASDAAPLALFEPKEDSAVAPSVSSAAFPALKAGEPMVEAVPELSPEQQRYMGRFRREYCLLYVLRFGVDWLEKQKDFGAAVRLLRLLLALAPRVRSHAARKMGHFWLRLSLDCVHLTRSREPAHAVAVRALERSAAELSLADTIKLQQRVQMLARLLRHKPLPDFPLLRELKAAVVRETIAGTLLRRELGRKSLFEGQDGEPCSVEELVLQHYASIGGWSGVHCEGSLWRSLALLLLWELVYDSAVPHVFQQPCQTVPMDLYSPFFALNRQTALETFVAGIRSGALDGKQLLQLNYEANFNVLCPVNWSYPLEHLCAVVDGMSRDTLADLLLYAANDFRLFGKGMPDLCLWRERGAPRLLLVEVKGPRDRLSPEQEAHLLRLNQIGLTAIVTHVREAGGNAEDEEEEGEEEQDVDDE